MNLSLTLAAYLGKRFLLGIAIVFGAVMVIVFMVDVVEMLRQFGDRDGVGPATALGLSLLKMPNLGEQVFPFAFLFGAMWAFTQLARSNELVVARASGVSVWQFLAPALIVAFLAGSFIITVYNPVAAVMISRYSELDSRLLQGQVSQLSLQKTGLWLRQSLDGNQSVIHARQVNDSSPATVSLREVIVFQYEGKDRFTARIDAESAVLKEPNWELTKAWVTAPGKDGTFHETYLLPTDLTRDRIEDSFASPKTLSFWDLPQFIETAEAAGFSVERHRLHWHSILSTPFLLMAMVFIAATFTLRHTRQGGVALLVVVGALTGFALFFVSDLSAALGQSGIVPPALAAWAPTIVATLLGMTMLFHLEDG